MRIIFGGAFNPPTIAHKDIYYFIQSKLDFSWFVYLPVSCLYHKEGLASNEDRYQMLKLLTKEMPKAKVSKDEYKDDKYLGTYHYLISQKEESWFLIGSDNLRDLKTWINYEKLVEDCRFIVISRGNMDDIGYIESDPLLSRFREHFLLLRGFDENVSSSSFRKTHDESLVTKEVLDYINKHNLYGGTNE